MGTVRPQDPYTWQSGPGRKSYRPLRPFRGMYHDVRRRLPYYRSDIKDGGSYRVFAGLIRIFFVNLLPALAFQLDMSHNTDGFFGVNEALLSSALAAIVFSTLSCQPLTVVGITGLISLFNYTIFHILQLHDVSLYPNFMVWVGIWSAIFHWLTAVLNLCDYMRTVTDFSAETFSLYVGTVYVIKGVEELSVNFYNDQITNGFASALVGILYFLTVYFLEQIKSTSIGGPWIRAICSDYAYPIATVFWTGITHVPGNLAYADFERLPVTRAFYPTVARPWVVSFWDLPVKWIFVAMPFGMLMTLLFYYDHNVSSLTAQARNFPLTKPAGFHWDFFLLGCTCFAAGILNIPLPNGLVPQAPVHTDSLTTYAEEPRIITPKEESETEVIVKKTTKAVHVAEQRVSHFLMGLAFIGIMTRPFLVVLHTIPRAIFSGVFFVVGFSSILNNPILTHKLKYLLTEKRFVPSTEPLNSVPRRQIAHYVAWQLLGWAVTLAISQTLAAIGFPVLIVALIPLRWCVLPRFFKKEELQVMDALTADADVVLYSLGGRPEMPEVSLDRERLEREGEEEDTGRDVEKAQGKKKKRSAHEENVGEDQSGVVKRRNDTRFHEVDGSGSTSTVETVTGNVEVGRDGHGGMEGREEPVKTG